MILKFDNKLTCFFLALLLVVFCLSSCSNQEKSEQKYMESANAYIDAKEYKKAELELKNIVQMNPQSEEAYLKLSDIYRIQVKPEKEIKALVQAITLNPNNMEAQYRLGQVYLLGRQTKRARETAQVLLSKEPDSIRAYHMLATAQVQERNANAAIKTLNKAIEISPDNPHLYLFLGFIQYYEKKDFQSSEVSYLNAIALDNTIQESYQELVTIYVKEKKLDKAEKTLIDLTKIKEGRFENLHVLANFYEAHNQFNKAEEVYETIIEEGNVHDYLPVYNLALFYARHQNYETAISFFKKALTLNNVLKIREELAKVYLDMKSYDEAEKQASKILEKEPNNTAGRLVISQTLMAEKKFSKAIEKLEQILAIDNENVMAYYLKAVCLMEKDLEVLPAQEIRMVAAGYLSAQTWKRNLAVESLKAAINLEPGNFMARLLLADIYVKSEKMVLADKQIKYILNEEPDNFRAFLMLGNIKIIQKEWDIAETIFKKITDRSPKYSLAYVKLGIVYNAQKRYKMAVEEFKKALDVDSRNMDAMRHIVSTYMSHNQKQDALNILKDHSTRKELTSFEKGYLEFLLGKIALSENNADLAEKHFNRSIQIHGETTPSYEALARIAEVQNNNLKAIEYNRYILSYDPKYLPALMNLNRIFQIERDMTKAKEVLEKVLAIKEDHVIAANEMAYILANEGKDLQRALRLARIAESQDPDNPNILDTLGWIYYKQKSYDLAINKLLSSIKGNPNNPITNYHLGWAYYDTGRYEKARKYMKIALKLNPNFEGAGKAREIIGE